MISTLAADAQADARFQEEIAAHYRDYLAYLEAQLTLLDIQAARTGVAFERAESCDDDEQAARTAIAGIPSARRALFDAVVEHERQEAQTQLERQAHQPGERARRADPDEAARLALTRLRDEANGAHTESGKGLLPYGKPDAIKWYAVDSAALRAAPTAAAYSAGALDRKARQRIVWQASAAIGVILLALVWLLVPKGGTNKAALLAPGASANGALLTPWPVQGLVVTDTRSVTTTVPVSATTTLVWPAEQAAAPKAYWRSAMVWPLRLCLPSDMLAELKEIQVLGSGTTPNRVYTLLASPPAADLIIESCQSGANVPPRAAVLRSTTPLPIYAIGKAVPFQDGSLTVTAVTLIGSGQDPTLPPEQARVTVRVQTALKLDWPLLAPTLLLPSGSTGLPSDISATEHGAELRYLVPRSSEPLALAWSITPRVGAPVLRWRVTLEPPPIRAAVLREALDVRDVRATGGSTPGTVVATMTLVNRSRAPLLLTAADLALAVATRPLATPELAALRQPLAPGEQRALSITAQLAERETLTLTVGVNRFAIEATERR